MALRVKVMNTMILRMSNKGEYAHVSTDLAIILADCCARGCPCCTLLADCCVRGLPMLFLG
jgi:hypothetical protein